MFKSFEDFLVSKETDLNAFKEMEALKQLELQNEYNADLKKSYNEALANKASNEDLDAFKDSIEKSNESVVKAVEALAISIKSQAEKGGFNPEPMEKSDLIKLLEKHAKEAGSQGTGKISDETVKVNANQLIAEVNKAASLMTTANIVGANGYSPLFGNYIDQRIHSAPLLRSTIMDDITVSTQVGTENIYYTERKNEGGDAEWVAEGAAKPLADAEWHTSSEKAKEVAVFWKFTHRFLFHTRLAVQDFDRYARELMEEKIPYSVLLGNATLNTTEPNGIITLASAWVVPPAIASSTPMPNVYDAVLALATAIRIRGFKGEIVVRLNDVWSYMMKSATKDTSGQYIVPPFSSQDGTTIDGVRVKFDPEVPADKILGGVLRNFNAVICEDIMYFEGYENDDFRKNLISRKLEAFIGTYLPGVLRPSVIYADIDDILGDIEQGPPPTLPVISSISPSSGKVGNTVTITGTNLSGVTGIKFGTTNAPTFTIVSATSVTVTVPTLSIGSTFIEVSNVNGTSNAIAFTVTIL